VAVRDNQWVNRGDVLYAIDPRWLRLAVASAQADVESKRHEMLMRQDAAHRRTLIKNAISSEDVQQTGSAANVAAANYHGALAALDLAELNLAHATVRAPVSGYVTHLRLRPGDYATAGRQRSPSSMPTASGWWGILRRLNCAIFASGMPRRWC
jgi:multidrug resistance efflux pump